MIENAIRNFIVDELRFHGSVPDDLLLIERGVLDSLGILHLVGYLEGEFGIEIQDEELIADNFGTIRDIARLVRAKQSGSSSIPTVPTG